MEKQAAYLKFFELSTPKGEKSPYQIATIVLNRPKQANSFNGEMLDCITHELEKIKNDKSIRLLIFQGAGKHFSAGADLNWMKETAQLSYEENLSEANKLTSMFETLSLLDIPTIAVVTGGTYGGGVGIVACCDFAIATETAKFCLSEVKIGLLPAVVLPYLNRKTQCGQLRRHVLGGKDFGAKQAKEFGLIQVETSANNIEASLHQEVNQLLVASPEAQASYKTLQKHLSNHSYQQGPYTAAAIAMARASDFGKAGLNSFLQKSEAPWLCKLPEETLLLEEK